MLWRQSPVAKRPTVDKINHFTVVATYVIKVHKKVLAKKAGLIRAQIVKK